MGEFAREVAVRLKIVQAGEPVLRSKARALTAQEIASDEIQQLIEHMKETMRDAPGVGLAAPQVGRSLQLAVIEDSEEYLKGIPQADLAERERSPVPFQVIINPRITPTSEEAVEFFDFFAELVDEGLGLHLRRDLLLCGKVGWSPCR